MRHRPSPTIHRDGYGLPERVIGYTPTGFITAHKFSNDLPEIPDKTAHIVIGPSVLVEQHVRIIRLPKPSGRLVT